MRKIYFGDFRQLVIEQRKAIAATEPEAYSKPWFLLRYLKKIIIASEYSSQPWRVESSVKSMVRFYLDNIDERSDNGQRCKLIYEQYKETVKKRQETRYGV